jgi:predicted hydrolase (HD superfamily)
MQQNRQQFFEALQKQIEPNILNHSLAVEACMDGIFEYLASQQQLGSGEPPKEDWLLAGLIHDFDYGGEFKNDHPFKLKEVLKKYQLEVSPVVEKIIHAHAAPHFKITPSNKAEWAIYCADSLTGLIMVVAYVYPSRKLADVKVSSVLKRFLKAQNFAAGTRRNEVAECSKPEGLNIPLEKFIEICLISMQKIAPTIGV